MRGTRTYTPVALFPGLLDGDGAGGLIDEAGGTAVEFYYLAVGARKRRESLDESVLAERMREAADQVQRYLEDENLRRRHPSVGPVGLTVVFHGWEMVACDGPSADDHGRTTKRGPS